MPSWLSSLPIIGKLIEGTSDIVKEVVVDKDKQNQILGNLKMIEHQVHLAELSTKTIPWVDALHKMGRQILNLLNFILVIILVFGDVTITPQLAALIGGPNAIYQLVKGKGR